MRTRKAAAVVASPDVPRNTILEGDALQVLRSLPSRSVQCVITSPPYYGLRDYGTATWVGGKPSCQHRVGGQVPDSKAPGAIASGVRPGVDASRCKVCGAHRVDQQYGLEPTLDDYIARMLAVFDEVFRVLRTDGVCWLNIGDSYAGNVHTGTYGKNRKWVGENGDPTGTRISAGLKEKDLMLVPFRLALALQTAGWWVRQTIIWSKPAPMPESVTDRCTTSHEYVFLLTRSERYYYDAAAIAEPAVIGANGSVFTKGKTALDGRRANVGQGPREDHAMRNRRSVWTVNTEPYPDAHYAVFPTALITPMVLAGSRPGDLVLDPFIGSGTTAVVASQQGRDYLGIELNHDYADMARQRIAEEGRPVVLPRKQRQGMRKAGIQQSSLLDVAESAVSA